MGLPEQAPALQASWTQAATAAVYAVRLVARELSGPHARGPRDTVLIDLSRST